MRILYYNRELGQNFCPNAPDLKCLDPLIGAALVGAGGSLLSGIFGTENNDANIAMQRETNAQNYQIFKEQLAASNEQWWREQAENRYLVNQARKWSLQDQAMMNEYNSPQNQMRMARAAGINPYMVAGGQFNAVQSAGASAPEGSAPSRSMPSSPEMVAPQRENVWGSVGSQFGALAQTYFNNSLSEREQANKDKLASSQEEYNHNKGLADLIQAISSARQAGVSEKTIDETIRHNQVVEGETNRHNQSTEGIAKEGNTISAKQVNEQVRHNKQQEAIERGRLSVDRFIAGFQEKLAKSQISLNSKEREKVGAEISKVYQDVANMVVEGRIKTAEAIRAEARKRLEQINLAREQDKEFVRTTPLIREFNAVIGTAADAITVPLTSLLRAGY